MFTPEKSHVIFGGDPPPPFFFLQTAVKQRPIFTGIWGATRLTEAFLLLRGLSGGRSQPFPIGCQTKCQATIMLQVPGWRGNAYRCLVPREALKENIPKRKTLSLTTLLVIFTQISMM